tara:strand:+ start:299 stop:646 length:348 start_codon:yes stop_codon:yes gene_type:complete
MSEQYPKSEGGMWKNSAKANEKHPDWRGHIEVSSAQLRMLLAMAKENQANPDPEFKLKIQVAAWDRVAKQTGNQYFYLGGEVYKPSEDKAVRQAPVPDTQMQNAHSHMNDDDIPF